MNGMIDKKLQAIKEQCIKVYVNTVQPTILQSFAKKVGKKDKIEVVFFVMNLAMWRYQCIYELLSSDHRFNCHLILTVNTSFSKDQQLADLDKIRTFFTAKGISFIDYDVSDKEGGDVKSTINPDILFYPQPYGHILPVNHSSTRFLSKLLCYIPYGLSVMSSEDDSSWLYNTPFQNFAWKLYYPFEYYKTESEEYAFNHGRNVIISGYPNMDAYLSNEIRDVWKISDWSYKRLIWSPHFTITDKISALNLSNFLWMAQLMLDIAERYKDRLQIAFKPHPWLKAKLYEHSEWGQEKTDLYYNKWASMENTMLETGDFVDLFKTSDALINDSDSFVIEYMFVNKPVAFVAKDLDSLSSHFSPFGLEVLNQQYVVNDKEGVLAFIEDVVIGGNDTKKSSRTSFVNEKLKPQSTGTTSQFIVNDIKRSLGITD